MISRGNEDLGILSALPEGVMGEVYSMFDTRSHALMSRREKYLRQIMLDSYVKELDRAHDKVKENGNAMVGTLYTNRMASRLNHMQIPGEEVIDLINKPRNTEKAIGWADKEIAKLQTLAKATFLTDARRREYEEELIYHLEEQSERKARGYNSNLKRIAGLKHIRNQIQDL